MGMQFFQDLMAAGRNPTAPESQAFYAANEAKGSASIGKKSLGSVLNDMTSSGQLFAHDVAPYAGAGVGALLAATGVGLPLAIGLGAATGAGTGLLGGERDMGSTLANAGWGAGGALAGGAYGAFGDGIAMTPTGGADVLTEGAFMGGYTPEAAGLADITTGAGFMGGYSEPTLMTGAMDVTGGASLAPGEMAMNNTLTGGGGYSNMVGGGPISMGAGGASAATGMNPYIQGGLLGLRALTNFQGQSRANSQAEQQAADNAAARQNLINMLTPLQEQNQAYATRIQQYLNDPNTMYREDPALRQLRKNRLDAIRSRQLATTGGTSGQRYAEDLARTSSDVDRANLQTVTAPYVSLMGQNQGGINALYQATANAPQRAVTVDPYGSTASNLLGDVAFSQLMAQLFS